MSAEELMLYDKYQAHEEATRAKKEQAIRVDAQTIAECRSEKECLRMWAAAQSWVARNIPWKVQSITDGFLETYGPPEHSPQLAARIVKEPIGATNYRFVATFWCNNIFGCNPSVITALADFNNTLRNVSIAANMKTGK